MEVRKNMVNENERTQDRKKERKDETFMFRLTESDEGMLQYLSYRLDKSRSEIMRRALQLYYYAMEDQLD